LDKSEAGLLEATIIDCVLHPKARDFVNQITESDKRLIELIISSITRIEIASQLSIGIEGLKKRKKSLSNALGIENKTSHFIKWATKNRFDS